MQISNRAGILASIAGAAAWFMLGTSGAWAASGQTWVSGSGKDSGGCTVPSPCATFQYAEEQTVTGGTINVATSGSFGVVTVSKSLSIISADGIQAVITVPANGTGIVVNAPGGIVLLKGLHISGQKIASNNGIIVDYVAALTVDHVSAVNLSGAINPFTGFVLIKSSLFEGNTYGVYNSGANIFMGDTTVSGNVDGIVGSLNSYGDNDMNGNTECDVCDATITEVGHDQ